MDRLYRLMYVLICTVFFSISAKAQWSDDLDRNLLISASETNEQDLVQIGKTSDNKVFISWISWENGNAYIKLQLLDKDGNPLLGEGGMYVCKYPTPSWSSGFGFAVSQDNCALIVNSDIRNGNEEGWKPFLYKISQTGEHLFTTQGIPVITGEGVSGLEPHICVTSENNMIMGFKKMSKNESSKVIVTKLLSDGTKAWGEDITIEQSNTMFNLIPTKNDGFILAYIEMLSSNTGNYIAKRYTANGEEAWENKTFIDESGSVMAKIEPFCISDGHGGLFSGYRYAYGNTSYGAMQGMNYDGKTHFEEIKSFPNQPSISLDRTGDFIYAASTFGNYFSSDISLSKFSTSGEEVWKNEALTENTTWQYTLYGVVSVDDGAFVVYRNATDYKSATIECSKVDLEGNTVAKNVAISSSISNKSRGGIVVLENQFVIAWTEKYSETGGKIYAQNVECTASSIEPTNQNESWIKFYQIEENQYSIDINMVKDENTILSLLDCSGKIIFSSREHLLEGVNTIAYPVEKLSDGIYILSVTSDSSRFQSKIVIR